MTHPAQFSPEILQVLEELIAPGESVHDPFAGPGLRLAKLCDHLGAAFTGTDIEAWPGGDPRVRTADARDPAGYPPGEFTICTSPVYLNKRFGDYANGPTPRTKTKGRRDYGIALGRPLHAEDNFARVTGKPGHAAGYWQSHREAVAHWGGRVLLNVDGPLAGAWVGLLVERNYRIEETILATTHRYRGLANADKRAAHEVVIVAASPNPVTETTQCREQVSVTRVRIHARRANLRTMRHQPDTTRPRHPLLRHPPRRPALPHRRPLLLERLSPEGLPAKDETVSDGDNLAELRSSASNVIRAARQLADWYRQGGSADTPRYRQLMGELAHTVAVYRTTTKEEP